MVVKQVYGRQSPCGFMVPIWSRAQLSVCVPASHPGCILAPTVLRIDSGTTKTFCRMKHLDKDE